MQFVIYYDNKYYKRNYINYEFKNKYLNKFGILIVIDLATFDEIEKYMYGGPDATAYFVRETRKSTWFTQVPVVLSRASGTP